jgi:hypothetical protein
MVTQGKDGGSGEKRVTKEEEVDPLKGRVTRGGRVV